MVETPDLYWDRPELEGLFNGMKSVLSLRSRTNVSLNILSGYKYIDSNLQRVTNADINFYSLFAIAQWKNIQYVMSDSL